jgi:deoxyhypusine synthase
MDDFHFRRGFHSLKVIMVKDNRPTRDELLRTPITMVDVSGSVSIGELVEQFSKTSFQARKLSDCVNIYGKMTERDGTHTVFMGLAGSIIAAGLRKVIRDMICNGLVDVICTTGAVVYQDYYQAMGYRHYRGSVDSDDVLLHDYMIDRIYDTYVDEDKFRETDVSIGKLLESLGGGRYSTREFLSILGEKCRDDEESILGAAYRENIPIYCPAIADSSIGIGLSTSYKRQREAGKPEGDIFVLDTIRDNYEMAQIMHSSPATGAVYLGGGVPKNYINDAVVMADMIFGDQDGHEYAIQVTMDRPDWGGLSGSTLGEAQSWGKIDAQATHQMVNVELSVALPLIAGALMESRSWSKRKGPRFIWTGDTLREMR